MDERERHRYMWIKDELEAYIELKGNQIRNRFDPGSLKFCQNGEIEGHSDL